MDVSSVFPRPKSVHPEPGEFRPLPGMAVHAPEGSPATGQRLAALAGLPLRLDASGWHAVIGNDAQARVVAPPQGDDGYAISVEPDRVELAASGARALGYAVTTYEQLGPGCGRLVDFADLAVRGMHLDLKGPMMHREFLHQLVERLGKLRINTVLIEYEDKFPYRNVPDVPVAEALTDEALRVLLSDAADWGMTVIPLVQCLGHLEYVLRGPTFADLAEDGNRQQVCPSHPDALRPFTAMLDELVDAHPEAPALHIGGDEPWSLGRCPRCRPRADRDGRAALYLEHVASAAQLVVDHGLRPILWDDVLYSEKCPQLVDALPEQTEIMCWEYHVYADQTPYVRWGRGAYAVPRLAWRDPGRLPELSAADTVVDLEDLPDDEQHLLRAIKYDGRDEPLGRPLPWVPALQSRGRTVLGAAAARGADGRNVAFSRWSRRVANTAVWARQARALALPGVVSTAWAAYDGLSPPTEPLATAAYTLTASGELYWNTSASVETIDRHIGPAAEVATWLEAGARLRDRTYLLAASRRLADLEDQPALTMAVKHALLVLESEELGHSAAWHAHYGGAGELAIDAARASLVTRIDTTVGRWCDWQRAAQEFLRTQFTEAGAKEVAAAKTHKPMSELIYWKDRLRD